VTGKGIRAEARDEMRRQASLRQDAGDVVRAIQALVDELVEAEVPAAMSLAPMAYKSIHVEGVLTIPPIHPSEGGGIPPWPTEGLGAVAYELTVSPLGHYVDLQGPYELSADGRIKADDDDRYQDPPYVERFKTGGEAGHRPFATLVERIRELAIMREVALISANEAPAP
jgi:hypothetical protein